MKEDPDPQREAARGRPPEGNGERQLGGDGPLGEKARADWGLQHVDPFARDAAVRTSRAKLATIPRIIRPPRQSGSKSLEPPDARYIRETCAFIACAAQSGAAPDRAARPRTR